MTTLTCERRDTAAITGDGIRCVLCDRILPESAIDVLSPRRRILFWTAKLLEGLVLSQQGKRQLRRESGFGRRSVTQGGEFAAWRHGFVGRTQAEETECFRTQARAILTEISKEFRSADERPLTPAQAEVRKRYVATLFHDLIDLKNRAVKGCVRGSGLRGDRDSEWCFPLEGNDNQLGELKHPVLVGGQGSTEIFGWQFRMYFAAPLVEPGLILFLVFARKPSGGLSSEWQATQRGHIQNAKAEFAAWHATRRLGHSLPRGEM